PVTTVMQVTAIGLSGKVGPAEGQAAGVAKANAAELAAQAGQKPTMTSVAVSRTTGRVFAGSSGEVPASIHPEMQQRMPQPSLEPWRVSNCAEFNTCNRALQDGEKMSDLEVHTLRVKNGEAAPRCANCQITTEGATVTSDPAPGSPPTAAAAV